MGKVLPDIFNVFVRLITTAERADGTPASPFQQSQASAAQSRQVYAGPLTLAIVRRVQRRRRVGLPGLALTGQLYAGQCLPDADDGGIVLPAVSRSGGGQEQLVRRRGQRQREGQPPRLVEHDPEILDEDARSRERRVVARQDVRHPVLHIHELPAEVQITS